MSAPSGGERIYGAPEDGDAAEAAAAFGDYEPEGPPSDRAGEGPDEIEGLSGPGLPEAQLDDQDLSLSPVPFGRPRRAPEAPAVIEEPQSRGPQLEPPPEASWGRSGDFEVVERIQVESGPEGPAMRALPALRQMEEGLRFLALGGAPSRHFLPDGLGAELLKGAGQSLAGVPVGGALRTDPHDAAKRPPEVAVEPPTLVSKEPILPPRFNLEAVDDLLPVEDAQDALPMAPPAPRVVQAPEAPRVAPSVPRPEARELATDGTLELRPADGLEAEAGLRFHRGPAADAIERAIRSEPLPAAPAGAAVRPVPARGEDSGRSGGYGVWHLVAAGGIAAIGALALGQGLGRPHEDPVVAYALGERSQALAYLDMQISALEQELAKKELSLREGIQGLGAVPSKLQLVKVEALGRERNHLAISLGALRRRREHLVGGGRG